MAFLDDDMGYFGSNVLPVLTRQDSKKGTVYAKE
jgi:hypothetical protein